MNNLKIIKKLKQDTPYKNGRRNSKKFVVVHMTGNTSRGANALAHAILQYNGNSRGAAWHYSVDAFSVYQSFTHDFQLWQSGDGRGKGNNESISVEICVNSDGDYIGSLRMAALLVAHICKTERIPTSNIKQHFDFSGKNCPSQLRAGKDGVRWFDFIGMIRDIMNGTNSAPPLVTKPVTNGDIVTNTGASIVDYLTANKIDASYSNRARLAKQHNIRGYTGTASQNTKLLQAITNKVVTPTTPKPTPVVTANNNGSIVDYLSANGIDASYKNRARLAVQYGVTGYTGTAAQNSTLLLAIINRTPTVSTPQAQRVISVGATVQVSKTATKYATGQSIASHVKGNRYKVLQIKSDSVLLDKILSWVRISDII